MKPLALYFWLFCRDVRNDNWESATVLQNLAWNYTIADNGEEINHIVSGLYLLEGLIIYMVNKMDMKNLRASTKADRFICSLFRKLQKTIKNWPLMVPR